MSTYHEDTAYSRHSMGGYALDWSQQPDPFKHYKHRETLPLPAPRLPQADFWRAALSWPPAPAQGLAPPDAADVAAMLLMSAGITAQGVVGLRAPASAGALFPSELYLTACGIAGLADGLYHFAPQAPGLRLLWEGKLAARSGTLWGRPPASLSLAISAMYWRSLWKYRSRAYRYCLLDSGHMLANLELALAAIGLAPHSGFDFNDQSLGVFLGLASEEEAALATVSAGKPPKDPGPADPGLPPFDREALPLSQRIGRDQRILAAHEEGCLGEPVPLPQWPRPEPGEDALSLPGPHAPEIPLLEVVRKRRSRRNFLAASLRADQVSALLAASLPAPGPCSATVLTAKGPELSAGTYRYLPGDGLLQPVVSGQDFRPQLGRASLGQLWVGQAALCLVLWADLEQLERIHGPRAYRHAMLAAGRAGQRLYLAATALGLGCCGVGAFYDDEVATVASLPEGASPLYLLAAGPVKGLTPR